MIILLVRQTYNSQENIQEYYHVYRILTFVGIPQFAVHKNTRLLMSVLKT